MWIDLHLFPVRHPARERLAELLRAEGIAVGLHYAPAAHSASGSGRSAPSSRPVELPESEALAREELSLPMFPELSDAEIDRIGASCRAGCADIASSIWSLTADG